MPSPEPQIRALSDPRVARITHYFTHYNEPLLHELMQAPEDRSGITYSLYSDVTSPDHTLKLVDPALATCSPWDGGLRCTGSGTEAGRAAVVLAARTLRLAWARGHDGTDCHRKLLLPDQLVACSPCAPPTQTAHLVDHRPGGGRTQQTSAMDETQIPTPSRRSSLLRTSGTRPSHRRWNGPGQFIRCAYNSMPLPECLDPPPPAVTAELRAGLFSDPSLPTLIHSGRLRSERRVDLVLKCARALSDEGFPVNVILIGQGPANASLETLTQELRLCGRVHMAGACYDAERLAQLFHASDLCVAPGGIGLLCIQAMAHGVPCITHDDHYGLHAGGHGGQGPEHEAIVPGRTGMLFPNGDFRGLVRCVRQWFATAPPKDAVSTECRRLIRMYYSPRNQADVIDAAVLGIPATHVVQLQDFGHVVDPASTPE